MKVKFSPLLGMWLICCSCASILGSRNDGFEEWADHQNTTLLLSKAILSGARHLMNEILISGAWFKDMDISIVTRNTEVLAGRITDFTIHTDQTKSLFTEWRITRLSEENVEYINTLALEDIHGYVFPVETDSLFLSLSESSATFRQMRPKDLQRIKIVFWRDLFARDPVAVVNLARFDNEPYQIIYPDISLPEVPQPVPDSTITFPTSSKLDW